jgi:hypothetical protein
MSSVRYPFRRSTTPWLRIPASIGALIFITLAFPFIAIYQMREDYIAEAKTTINAIKGEYE